MKRTTISLFIVVFLALILAGCGTSLAVGALPGAIQTAATATPVVDAPAASVDVPVTSNSALAALQGNFEQIYSQVGPSVVNIQVEMSGSGSNSGFAFPGQSQGAQEALGSGFVWDTSGHIVTNNHVIEGASKITVMFADGSTVDAKLVGADPNADLAVVQVNVPAAQLHPVTMADSSKVKVGQLAIAIGNPYGLSGTMTTGIVSALSRSLPVGSETSLTGGSYTIPDIIQTDAAINPGNSGGVLVNVDGQVLGVTTAIRSSTNANSGIGFVVPSNIVSKVVPSLIKTGKYEHPRLGISGTTLTSDLAVAMKLSPDQKGVLIIDVSANSPAAKAGLKGSDVQTSDSGQQTPTGGDVITAIDGQPVTRFDDLSSYLFNNTEVGQTVTLTILRQGREQSIKVTPGVLQ